MFEGIYGSCVKVNTVEGTYSMLSLVYLQIRLNDLKPITWQHGLQSLRLKLRQHDLN